MERFIYGALFTSITGLNLFLALRCLKKKSHSAMLLGCCCTCAALISFFYTLSIMTDSYFVMSVTSSIYFCFIDCMLLFLMDFFSELTGINKNTAARTWNLLKIFRAWTVADCLVLLTNPLHNQAIRYALRSGGTASVAVWVFEPHTLYRFHLLLCYLIIAHSLFILCRKTVSIPSMYRGSYIRIIAFTLFIVALNAGFLLQKIQQNIDYSIMFYTILGFGIYWTCFVSGDRPLLNQARQEIIENSGQPMLLFDYSDRLILSNQAAKNLFPFIASDMETPDIQSFIRMLNMETQFSLPDHGAQFYWTSQDSERTSYICSFSALKNRTGETVARLFVFTSNVLGIDPLTGFQSEQTFSLHRKEISSGKPSPVGVAVCDLNRLSLLNNTIGRRGGDLALSLQAKTMKKYLPATSAFIRLSDANLCAVCYGLDRNELKKRLADISDELNTYSQFPFRLKIDSAIYMLEEGVDAVDAAERAMSILKTRKLLDSESDRSSTIDSLRQMLTECDPETESHVQRTRTLGDNLAYRMGLSDYERDQLSLLCLFHDIGKVGIPLHILNKPGPLSDSEWEIMQTHVQKGYRIAKATPELNIVAEPILHHHEFWNGQGYPDKLQHESIPLLARIISVVDAYDAMITDRVYRKGRSQKEACEELLRCAGTQFDPYIVDVFVRMVAPETISESSCADALADPGNDMISDTHVAPSKTLLINPVRYSRYTVDGTQQIQQVDQHFEQLTGYTAYDVRELKLTQNDLLFEEDREMYWKIVAKVLAASNIIYLEHRIRRKDGTGRYVYCTGICSTDSTSEDSPPAMIIVSDITDSVSLQLQVGIARSRALMSLRRLEESIRLDPMTGLLNQAAFQKACQQELSENNARCLLMMMDVDDFKAYNDTYGHPQGDTLLICLASALSEAVKPDGIAGRMGGDEFCCLVRLQSDATLDEIHTRSETIWRAVNKGISEISSGPTISAGVVCSFHRYAAFKELYAAADRELYHAKAHGKNQLSIQTENGVSDH